MVGIFPPIYSLALHFVQGFIFWRSRGSVSQWVFHVNFAFYNLEISLTSSQNSFGVKIFFYMHCKNLFLSENYLAFYAPTSPLKPHWVYYQVKWVADLRIRKKWLIFLSTVSMCPFFIFWFIAHFLLCCLSTGLRSVKATSHLGGLLWLDMPHF